MSLADLNDIFKGKTNGFLKGIVQRKFSVFVSTVVHRQFEPQAVFSLLKLLICGNPEMLWHPRKGDALIDRARSHEASIFLRHKSCPEVLLFLDDDISYDPVQIVNMCRACYDGCDIVGGAYALKTEGKTSLAIKALNGEHLYFGENTGLQEVMFVSTGCMAIRRKVLEEMAKTLPLCHPNTFKFYPFFQPFPKEIEKMGWIYLSEDWSFCMRAIDLGFKVWVDGRVRLQHTGKYTYDWDDLMREEKVYHKDIAYKDNLLV